MKSPPNNTPKLEDRFLQPSGWQWHNFMQNGRHVRIGSVMPQEKPETVVVCLPGLSEFSEKYFETARDCLKQNLGFIVIDWPGQGKSERLIRHSQKRHSLGYAQDVDALHTVITRHIKVKDAKLAMLAHSMGAHIGLHYLIKHPDIFTCAAFSTPLLAVKGLQFLGPLAGIITRLSCVFTPTTYVAGFGDWRESVRGTPAINFYSSDESRNAIHNSWCLADPTLQVGGITYGWLYETHRSCMELWRSGVLQSITIPCVMALAGNENFVSNAAIRKAASIMPDVKLLEFPDSRHEILMERDEIRKTFLNAFYELIKARKQG